MDKIKNSLFTEDSEDSESEIKTNNEYAKNYTNWRKKEELHKLKAKYGDDILEENESSSSSSEDDEDAAELTEEVEKDFLKTLTYLKKKNPKIYDASVTFFNESSNNRIKKKPKPKPMYIKDHERKLLLEKGGIFSDEEDNYDEKTDLPYTKEQELIKNEIRKGADEIDSDIEEENSGGLLKLTKKCELENVKEAPKLDKLDKLERFLRDHVLNAKDIPSAYQENVDNSFLDANFSEDEKEIEKQEEFEHKYNFRYEEPDQEFIKSYPRTIEQSLRRTDDRRKLKRIEIKERKQKEKEEKLAAIKKLQELKRKEIEEKLDKLKEVTGTEDLGFDNDDIDGDFDPEEHDKKMHQLFNEEFYKEIEEEQKPEFPHIDAELEIENWDNWNSEKNYEEPHCEDDDFNMDADYDPSANKNFQEEMLENSKSKKKRRKKSKVAEALTKPKPKYDPNDKNYEKYFDEYYNLDCEDIIGDLPCRFKYRQVVPNSFGLTVEEILLAKDKELNRWCSLKKTVQRRPDNVEKYDQIAYTKKGNNVDLKKKLIPSLFDEQERKEEFVENSAVEHSQDKNEKATVSDNKSAVNSNNKKKRKRNKSKSVENNKKKTKKDNTEISDSRLSAYGINPKKYKNKLKWNKK